MTTVSPHLHDLPPPGILAAPPSHTLQDGDRVVGWTQRHALGFLGFGHEEEAAAAAWIAWRAIARRLALYSGQRPIPIDVEPLTLATRDGRELILASGAPIARLCRPGETQWAPDGAFGFEIELDPAVSEVRLQSLGHLAYRALRRSGARWQLWDIARQAVDAPVPEAPATPDTPRVPTAPAGDGDPGPSRIPPPADDTPDAMNIIWRALVVSAVLVLAFVVTLGAWAAGVVSGGSVLLGATVAGAAALGHAAWRRSILRAATRANRTGGAAPGARLARLRAARAERTRARQLAPGLGGAR